MWQPQSWKPPSAVHALRIATISPCAVGSFVAVTLLAPVATISPSRTITAPNGPPRPDVTFSVASAIALSIKTWLPCIRLGILIARFARRESRNNQIMARNCKFPANLLFAMLLYTLRTPQQAFSWKTFLNPRTERFDRTPGTPLG